jgi:predicted DNA-binding transcriptional regulator AlpA
MSQLLSKTQAAAKLGVHPESLMRMCREGRFPSPVKLGAGQNSAVRFVEAEVTGWIAARMAARDEPSAA